MRYEATRHDLGDARVGPEQRLTAGAKCAVSVVYTGKDPDKKPSRWSGWIPPLRTKNPPSEYYFPKGKR